MLHTHDVRDRMQRLLLQASPLFSARCLFVSSSKRRPNNSEYFPYIHHADIVLHNLLAGRVGRAPTRVRLPE